MAKPTRTNSKPPAGKAAVDGSAAAAADPAGAPTPPTEAGGVGSPAPDLASAGAGAGVMVPPVVVGIDALFAHPDVAERAIVSVTAPIGARRRDGRKFGPTPTLIPLAEIGEAGLRAIDADPALAWALVGQMEAAD